MYSMIVFLLFVYIIMSSRKSNQFNNLGLWKNPASVPKSIRQTYKINQEKMQVFENLNMHEYASLDLNSEMTILLHFRSQAIQKTMTLQQFIECVENLNDLNIDVSMHFKLNDTNDLLNFNSYATCKIDRQDWTKKILSDQFHSLFDQISQVSAWDTIRIKLKKQEDSESKWRRQEFEFYTTFNDYLWTQKTIENIIFDEHLQKILEMDNKDESEKIIQKLVNN